jgi:hypothetical protein
VHWLCGEHAEARALLARMKARRDAEAHGLRIAILHARMGERDSAFAWLQHNRWSLAEFAMLSANQFLDPLRKDDRYPALMRRVGIR